MLSRIYHARRSDEGGFTLVELLVVLAIGGVVLTLVTSAIIGSLNATRRGEDRVDALNDLQRGLERISREMRTASPIILDPDGDYRDSLGARVVRGGEIIEYRYYLETTTFDDETSETELREDVRRFDSSGTPIDTQDGLFIANVANQATGTPLFTYFVFDQDSGEVVEIDCSSLTESQCRDRHLTAAQVRLTLEKVLDEQDPIQVETVVNIRNTRLVAED